jgi:hypothetical protein
MPHAGEFMAPDAEFTDLPVAQMRADRSNELVILTSQDSWYVRLGGSVKNRSRYIWIDVVYIDKIWFFILHYNCDVAPR